MKSTVEVFESILSKNDKAAAKIRADFNARGLLAINLMSSPGAGKTTLLERTIKEFILVKATLTKRDWEERSPGRPNAPMPRL